MAERKTVNRYYPPDFDPAKHKSINKYRNSHPLRERAKKLSQGILVIRFEMPYNIWCGGCGNHIGMGVRYNAEKKKVGKYYTTPIYRFRMKCHLCDNYIEMETDPKNFDYTIVSGAKRKNQKWDMAENEQVLTEDREAVKKLSRDAMYKLEHGVDDAKKLKKAAPTLSQIAEIQSAKKDDYDQNQMLRKKFRAEKKQLKAVEASDNALLAKSSLEIALVPETEEDKKLASLLKLSAPESYEEKRNQKREEIHGRNIFAPSSTITSPDSTESSPHSSTSLKSSQANKHTEAHRTLLSQVMKKRSMGVFGSSNSLGITAQSSRGLTDNGGKISKTAKCLSGGTNGFVVRKKRKRSVDEECPERVGKRGQSSEKTEAKMVEVKNEDTCSRTAGEYAKCEMNSDLDIASCTEANKSAVCTFLSCQHAEGEEIPEKEPLGPHSGLVNSAGVRSRTECLDRCEDDTKDDNQISNVSRVKANCNFSPVSTEQVGEDTTDTECSGTGAMSNDRGSCSHNQTVTGDLNRKYVMHSGSASVSEESSSLEAGEGTSEGSRCKQTSLSLVSCYSSSSGSEDDG